MLMAGNGGEEGRGEGAGKRDRQGVCVCVWERQRGGPFALFS